MIRSKCNYCGALVESETPTKLYIAQDKSMIEGLLLNLKSDFERWLKDGTAIEIEVYLK